MINPSQEYDFSRNDKFYELTIPEYEHYGELVYYKVHLRDLVKNKTYMHFFRFKELKEFHETLLKLKLQLPEFPQTHFWRKTNKNPKMILERKSVLEQYFNIVVNDPFTRGNKDVKKFISICKIGSNNTRSFSQRKRTSATANSRVKSQPKNSRFNSSVYQIKSANV